MNLRIYLRTNRPNAAGECLIYFLLDGRWVSTGVKVHPDFWDPTQCIILRKHPQFLSVNPYYTTIKSRAEQYIANFKLTRRVFSIDHFLEYVFEGPESVENPCFLKLLDDYIDIKPLSLGRAKHYKQLKKDITAIKRKPRLHDIDYTFAIQLIKYLKEKDGQHNNNNTITKKIRMLKALVHYAMHKDYIQKDPLINVKVKDVKGTRQHLLPAELSSLEQLYRSGTLSGNLQATLQYFLFSIYTGLRYSDVAALRLCHIKNNTLTTVQEKTGKPVEVPLIPQARALIMPRIDGSCFKVFTNQATNRNLKDIIAAAGIDKQISFHCARHTFGTLSLTWGIPKHVVAELMGIDLKTVEVYAKIIDQVKQEEMLKWGKAVAG